MNLINALNQSVNMAKFDAAENTLISCDNEGIVKIWDKRTMKSYGSIDCGEYSANGIDFERSGKNAILASEDFTLKILDLTEKK